MAYFQTKNPDLSKFWKVLQWKVLLNFPSIWYLLWPFGEFFGHLVCFLVIWYILWSFGILCGHLVQFPHFGMFYVQKSGNPVPDLSPEE
jgi:hypothetical protein